VLFEPPELGDQEQAVIAWIWELRDQLRFNLAAPRRWSGTLRRQAFARNVQGSNTIEGYTADLDDVVAIIDSEAPLAADEVTRRAIEGYRKAMTYVLQLCSDPRPIVYSTNLLRSLHFMMTDFDLSIRPGLWRVGPSYVRNDATGLVVYEGPGVEAIEPLVEDLMDHLNGNQLDPIVAAAMAHLNLVMIHPFRDGNGRMARCLQSLVLGRAGETLSPVFLSVEEYLGKNTPAYYEVLGQTGQGQWNPSHDTSTWIRFMLTAHLRQARTYWQRLADLGRLWLELVEMLGEGEDARQMLALMDAATGLRVTRAGYTQVLAANDIVISEQSATRDLRDLVQRGLLVAQGERRGRRYIGAEAIREVWQTIRAGHPARDNSDPFAVD